MSLGSSLGVSALRPLPKPLALAGIMGLVVVATAWWVASLALERKLPPSRCGPGLVAIGPRCCAPGQRLKSTSCVGVPRSCPAGFHRAVFPMPGCVVDPKKVKLEHPSFEVGPNDWESGGLRMERGNTGPFCLDASEVTYERWQICAKSGACPSISTLLQRFAPPRPEQVEPGLPVSHITDSEAHAFCHFAGGYLPRRREWLHAAAGADGRRFPWGSTGLVCRRAAFGLVKGPCGEGARGPDLAGARGSGSSPEGIFDLAGNVAELVSDSERARTAVAGGSYRSEVASSLKSWAFEAYRGPSPDVGFRCAYLVDLATTPSHTVK